MSDAPARPKNIRATMKNLDGETVEDTPTTQIVNKVKRLVTKTDSDGRTIKIRFLSTVDRMRIAKVLGGELTKNDVYLGYATLAYCVTEIDGDPIAPPVTVREVEFLVERLGDPGLGIVAEAYQVDFADLTKGVDVDAAKN